MWTIVFAVLAAVSAEVAEFPKCCPRSQVLISNSTEVTSTKINFQCIDPDTSLKLYNLTELSLVIGRKVPLKIGLPENCTNIVIKNVSSSDNLILIKNICYDVLNLEIDNVKLTGDDGIVSLSCDDQNFNMPLDPVQESTLSDVSLTNLRMCCPPNKVYDGELHMCRNSTENISNDWFLKELNDSGSAVYEMMTDIRCKANEFTIELFNQFFDFNLDKGVLRASRKSDGFERIYFGSEWCVSRAYTGGVVILACSRDCASFDALCLRKCCPLGQYYVPFTCGVSSRSMCAASNSDELHLNLTPVYEHSKNFGVKLNKDTIAIRSGLQCSTGKFTLDPSTDKYHIATDGKLHLPRQLGLITEDYCIETFDHRSCNLGVKIDTVTCFHEFAHKTGRDFTGSFVALTASCVFLFLTLVVYCSLPELRNLHGRTLICHVSTMLLAFACLARAQYDKVQSDLVCSVLGYTIYFGFVSAFTWLNVMCVDIWWTFGSVRAVQPLRKASAGRRRFMWYSLYAWSAAIVLTLTMLLLDLYPVASVLDANMGANRCWFAAEANSDHGWPHYIFFIIPMGVMNCCNFVLWARTAWHCHRVKAEVHRMQAGSKGDNIKRNFRADRARYLLTVKLWVVMGAGWIWELFSTIVTEPQWLWGTVDIINCLQGVSIFVILVLKPKVYYLIRKVLGLEAAKTQKSGVSSAARTSSTFLSRSVSSEEHNKALLKTPKLTA